MKKSKSLLIGMFLSPILGSGLGSARANDVSLNKAPVESFYCRERLPTMDRDTDSWNPAAPNPGDPSIDGDERCTNDPPGLEPSQRAEAITAAAIFNEGDTKH